MSMGKWAVVAGVSLLAITGLQAAEVSQTSTSVVPEIVVQAKILKEEQPVGPYQQPEWTTERRFPTTRVYLQEPPGEMGLEQWWRMRKFRDGSVQHRFQEEFEIGLPYRFQLDLYETWMVESGNMHQDEASVELRWAFADWGRIPMNPTLYAEYAFHYDDPDGVEVKLLLGDEISPAWHYGINVICEQGLWGSRSTEYTLSAALGRTVIDRKLSIGVEGKYASATEAGSRGDPEEQALVGPSFQWRITPKTHLDFVPLVGLTDDAPRMEAWVVLGYDFGPSSSKQTAEAPISTKGK